MEVAPVILFIYNRAKLTQRTVEALLKNDLASETVLYIFADGAKENATPEQIAKVKAARDYVKTIKGFKDIIIEEAPKNKGLANSVISGVTKVVNKHGRVIVVEDDIMTSPHFLHYMNLSLDLYEDNENVVCINGYSQIRRAPIIEKTYFQIGADCWGWATWKRGWANFNPDSRYLYRKLEENADLRKTFTYNGTYPYMEMLQNQIEGKVDSWAIRWLASAVINHKLCLYPKKSLVQNIGFGADSTHCSDENAPEAKIRIDESADDFPAIECVESELMRRVWETCFMNICPARHHIHGKNRFLYRLLKNININRKASWQADIHSIHSCHIRIDDTSKLIVSEEFSMEKCKIELSGNARIDILGDCHLNHVNIRMDGGSITIGRGVKINDLYIKMKEDSRIIIDDGCVIGDKNKQKGILWDMTDSDVIIYPNNILRGNIRSCSNSLLQIDSGNQIESDIYLGTKDCKVYNDK